MKFVCSQNLNPSHDYGDVQTKHITSEIEDGFK